MNVSALKSDYSPIPDVDLEKQDEVSDSPESPVIDEEEELKILAEKYPEANEFELKFLGALDQAISKYGHPKVKFPMLPANGEELGSSSSDSIPEFLNSLTIPTATFITCAAAGMQVLAMDNPIYQALYPYVSCIILFLSSVAYLRQRFILRCEAFVGRIQSQIGAVASTLQSLSTSAIKQLDDAEARMDAVLKPIKEKLDKVTEFEEKLRVIDPDIDIPDVSDIEEAFDGCTDKIESVFQAVLKFSEAAASNAVPEIFQSVRMLTVRLLYPFLAVVLVLQLVAVFATETTKSNIVPPEEDETLQTRLMELIVTPFISYITTITALAVGFGLSQLAKLIKKVNDLIKDIEGEVNQVLKDRTGEIFDLVFKQGMGNVRAKTLKLIKDVEKLEAPLKKVTDMMKLKFLQERAREEAEAKAKEAAESLEKAKEENERKARDAAEKAKEDAEKKAKESNGRVSMLKKSFGGGKKRFGF